MHSKRNVTLWFSLETAAGRCADVILETRQGSEGDQWRENRLGSFGMLHPDVLKAYELRDPSSAVEMDLEPLI